jgi:hypothetical protein
MHAVVIFFFPICVLLRCQATCAFMNGLVFASYRLFAKIQLDNDNAVPTIAQVALAGAGSGIVSSCVIKVPPAPVFSVT